MKIYPFIFLLFIVLGCSETEKPPPANLPPVSVSAADLTRAYEENELSADEKYKNRLATVSGNLSDVAEVAGTVQGDLTGHTDKDGIGFMSVKCSFPDSEKANLSKLKKGQPAKFQGTITGKTLNLYVDMTDCKVLP